MILRFAPAGFFMLAIVLFGAAGVAYFLENEGPGAVIDEPERELPELAIGKHEVTFRLRNPTWHTVRVVGAGECWGVNCGFSLKRDIPFELAPGESVDLECTLETREAGAFTSQIHLYLDDIGLREIVLRVDGTAQEAGKAP